MARAARGGAGESAVKPGRRSAFGGQARCQLAPVPPPPPRGRLQPPPPPPPPLTGLESVHWFIGGPNPGQGQSPWPRPAQCAAMAAGPAASGPPSAQHRPDKPAHDKPERRRAREGSVIHRRAWPPVTRIRLLLCRRREHVGPSVGLSSTSRHGQTGGPSWPSGIGGLREKLKRRLPGRSRRCTGVSALARPSCGPGEANSRPFRGSDSDPNGPDPDGGSVSRTGLP